MPRSCIIEPETAERLPIADEVVAITPLDRAVEPRSSGGLFWGLVRTARPRQWVKNVLVFAAPGAAGVLTEPAAVGRAALAFILFCLAASGAYFLNDALDREADRRHETKRHRPIAAGVVPLGAAFACSFLLLAAAVGGAVALQGGQLALFVGIYVALTLCYSVYLKHEPVLDIATVAGGFVIRAIAGAVAVDVPLSNWFLIVASFGSLFMVVGKRHAEHRELGDDRGSHRATLATYSADYLQYARTMAAAVTVTAYCVWAFEKAEAAAGPVWFQLSVIPFVLSIMRYALLLDLGQGGAPEEVVLGDRTLQVLGLIWVVLFVVGVHGS